jgi:hypothetical protein
LVFELVFEFGSRFFIVKYLYKFCKIKQVLRLLKGNQIGWKKLRLGVVVL